MITILKITITKEENTKRIALGLTTTTMDRCMKEGAEDMVTEPTVTTAVSPLNRGYK